MVRVSAKSVARGLEEEKRTTAAQVVRMSSQCEHSPHLTDGGSGKAAMQSVTLNAPDNQGAAR